MKLDIPEDKVERFIELFKDALGIFLVSEMKRKVAVDTGDLKKSIRYEKENDKIVFYMREHGLYVEYDTKPHVIRPKNGKALAWGKEIGMTKDGKTMRENVAREVHHPGTQAQPFIRPTFHGDFNKCVQKAVETAVASL